MRDAFDDQAAGLRRLFRAAPPEVLTVVPCGAAGVRWVARQLTLRVQAGLRVLAMDESVACGNLADCLGASPRFDLLQAAEGHVPAQRCLVPVMPGLHLAPVGRLARAVGPDRLTNQRVVAQFQQLQAEFDEWIVLARPSDLAGLSPLALAAPRLLLAVDPHPVAVTEAYATLKRIASGADTLSIGLALAGGGNAGAKGLVPNLQAVAGRQLGVDVNLVSSIGECLGLGSVDTRGAEPAAFIERLIWRAQVAQRAHVVRGAGA